MPQKREEQMVRASNRGGTVKYGPSPETATRDGKMAALAAQGLDQDQIAEIAGVSQATVSKGTRRALAAAIRTRAQRDREITRLAKTGLSNPEIAEITGISPDSVRRALAADLDRRKIPGGRELQEYLWDQYMDVLEDAKERRDNPGIKLLQSGKPERLDDEGNAMEDVAAQLAADDLIRKTITDLRGLTGADAPKKSIRANVDLDTLIEAELAQLGKLAQEQAAVIERQRKELAELRGIPALPPAPPETP